MSQAMFDMLICYGKTYTLARRIGTGNLDSKESRHGCFEQGEGFHIVRDKSV
jgi:hypothetical protein